MIVARFHYRHEGELARGYLETAGVESVLLIDDAEVMSERTARELARLSRESEGALRFTLAAGRDAVERLESMVASAA